MSRFPVMGNVPVLVLVAAIKPIAKLAHAPVQKNVTKTLKFNECERKNIEMLSFFNVFVTFFVGGGCEQTGCESCTCAGGNCNNLVDQTGDYKTQNYKM